MNLEKIFQSNEVAGVPLRKLIKKHNPFNTAEELYLKSGLSQEQIEEFQKNAESVSIRQLNRMLTFCEFDLKLTALFDDDLEEVNITDELSDVYIKEDMDWEEELDWEGEIEEDIL